MSIKDLHLFLSRGERDTRDEGKKMWTGLPGAEINNKASRNYEIPFGVPNYRFSLRNEMEEAIRKSLSRASMEILGRIFVLNSKLRRATLRKTLLLIERNSDQWGTEGMDPSIQSIAPGMRTIGWLWRGFISRVILENECLKRYSKCIDIRRLKLFRPCVLSNETPTKLHRTIPINLKHSHVLLMNLSKGRLRCTTTTSTACIHYRRQ